VALEIFLGVGATLVTQPHNGAAPEGAKSADEGPIIAKRAITAELNHALEQLVHVIEGGWSVWVARQSHTIHCRDFRCRLSGHSLRQFFAHAGSPEAWATTAGSVASSSS